MTDETRKRIQEMIAKKRVVLFMKGSAMMPACGFSAHAIQLLKAAGAKDIATFDVLRDPELREGIKEFSSWPTIPQAYIDGKFIGGSDILAEMHAKNELAPLIAVPPTPAA
jgi:monothiol glutaredoxin